MNVRLKIQIVLGLIFLCGGAVLSFLPKSDVNQAAVRFSLCFVGISFLLVGFDKQLILRFGFPAYCLLRISGLLSILAFFWWYIFQHSHQLGDLLGPYLVIGFIITGITVLRVHRLWQLRRRYNNP